MAHVLEDNIVETSTTTGTGALTLAGAVAGFKTFAAVCTSPSDTVDYLIEAIDGSGNRTGDWELGLGTYSAASTLTRTTVRKSSNGDALVNFAAGTKRAMIYLPAYRIKHRGALAKKAADQTAINFTTAAVVTWDGADVLDTDAFHDPVTNNSRMTIPSGISLARLSACVTFANITADSYVTLIIRKNASATYDGRAAITVESSLVTPSVSVVGPVIPVIAGDYFEVFATVETDTSVDITAALSWFAIEVVE